jgi:hypothetical protein
MRGDDARAAELCGVSGRRNRGMTVIAGER